VDEEEGLRSILWTKVGRGFIGEAFPWALEASEMAWERRTWRE
jgi:hypothetical protein